VTCNLQVSPYRSQALGATNWGMPAPVTALSDALARIGDRWSLLLVEALMAAPLRFADLQETVAGISTNILAARLRHLESQGVVGRRSASRHASSRRLQSDGPGRRRASCRASDSSARW